MKKHRDSDELAKRFLAAASKPAGITPPPMPPAPPVVPIKTSAIAEPLAPKPEPAPEAAEPPVKQVEEARAPKKSGKRDLKKNAANDDTVPMSLRPSRAMLNRYVQAAAQRTQSIGRVVSVQEIILEVMERGP